MHIPGLTCLSMACFLQWVGAMSEIAHPGTDASPFPGVQASERAAALATPARILRRSPRMTLGCS